MRGFVLNAWDVLLRGGAALLALGGGLGAPGNGLGLLLLLMAADIVTGVVRAALFRSDKSATGGLSFRAGLLGLLRKGGALLVVAIAALADSAMGRPGMLGGAAAWFYICGEALSVLENVAGMGVPVPPALRRALLGDAANIAR